MKCKMMVNVCDSLSLLFLNKILADAHLTRKLPTQQCDLRQSVSVYLKSTGDQEEGLLHYNYMICFVTVGTNAPTTEAGKSAQY